jgi:LytS/YehU family sensor histidine kinase
VKVRDRAIVYLARFARLMRSVLAGSYRTSIPLADEIENLHLYLYIESLRFEGCFRYRIDVDPAIDLRHARIPTMLIQPFVENAIRHGLRHRQGGGMLVISMSARGDAIHCRVEDDGIGRKRSAELRDFTARQRSMGMLVTRERLNILNAASAGERISMAITDLSDERGAPSGTRVDIIIPLELH